MKMFVNWFKDFIDYAFYHIHKDTDKDKDFERLYNVVDIELLFITWNRCVYDYKINDKYILSIYENDINDFIFKSDFYNFLWLSNGIQDYLIEKYHYNMKPFLHKREKHNQALAREFKVFNFILNILA
jgi:hypothetical protein